MSDRLGRGNCWRVDKAVGEDHHPAASAEIGDSGALIIRRETTRPRPTKPTNTGDLDKRPATVWEPIKAYEAHAWVYLVACDEAHEVAS